MFSIALILLILTVALVLFVTGWLRMDLVALLVLCTLAVTGLVTPEEALAGFSSPAVVTVWAMFILSAGLSRTGVGELLGRPLQRLAHRGERVLLAAVMATASLLSALINTITVAAILLPVVMDLSRRSRLSPSRLLMPMALGCLLGGPFTALSTPPNILITDALRSAGLRPFGLFEFTPPTALLVAAGILFVFFASRRLLPDRAPAAVAGSEQLGRWYGLQEHLFTARIAHGSTLAGKTLSQSRLGSALQLTALALVRAGRMELAPGPGEELRGGDLLVLHGQPDHLQRLHGRQHLLVEPAAAASAALGTSLSAAEARLPPGSPLAGQSVSESGLRPVHGCHLLAVRRGQSVLRDELHRLRLEAGDVLELYGEAGRLEQMARLGLIEALQTLPGPPAGNGGGPELLGVRVPEGSILVERSLQDSGLGRTFGLTVLAIARREIPVVMPHPDEAIHAGDLLLVLGTHEDLAVLDALQSLELALPDAAALPELESQQVGVLEAVLAPRSEVAGKSMGELHFRERYGLTVLAVWREGRPIRDGLRDLKLRYGDALLVHGSRSRLELLAEDPDFLVLDREAAQAPRVDRAALAGGIMIGVLAAAMLGWLPLAIAALTGASLMVLTRALTMEEAYRAIEWRAVFLIAGMLPLGAAMERTGAAGIFAVQLIDLVGGLGPRAVVAALFLVTAAATQVVPTAALVVLMTPIALTTAGTLGISPHTLMMTIALSASASFASPTSHPAHVLVMGPGCYRFSDYVKLGLPLTALAFLIVVLFVPVLWPP
jgi:di/tricarboxylate transporter